MPADKGPRHHTTGRASTAGQAGQGGAGRGGRETLTGVTRILTRSDLLSLLDPLACIQALREGFTAATQNTIPGRRVRTDLPFPGTATALLPGLLPGINAYTVKVNAKFPHASPALRGVICLHTAPTANCSP